MLIKRGFLLFSILCITFTLSAKKPGAYLSYTVFNSPADGPYIETYLSVAAHTVNYIKNKDGKYQASIEILTMFKKGEEIINYDKYEFFSPALEDTLDLNFSFLDVQRYSLPIGNYDFELQIRDINGDEKPFISLQPVEINFPENDINISGIQLIDTYEKTKDAGILSKIGYDMVPYIVNFYPENVNKVTFYSEIYNSDKVLSENTQYLVTYFIEPLERNEPLAQYVKFKKETTSPVNVVFGEFDIKDLKSGNYFITIEVKDRENKLLARNRQFFQRSNPRIKFSIDDLADFSPEKTFVGGINNMDTLNEYISTLNPIANLQERNFVEAHKDNSDLPTLQKFFYKFWLNRNTLEPGKEWEKYLNEVNKVNKAYSTIIMKGYETDRGRTYLKYGPPNAISENYNEPSAYPYEIWHYYVLKNGQRNKRFVFYTEDIVTNDFSLLHSDVTGEPTNYRWQYILHRRVDPGSNIDQSTTPDSWGGNSKKYFDLPH
ncbi:MAG: GWxTD domain-containing protein [Bacteroidales bacterium]|nr:GWxTD domain-containing protein [Bacteroidales bacterium]MCF8405679.1 GWxTD domain-containing protein [Bacteroidales bacterium]